MKKGVGTLIAFTLAASGTLVAVSLTGCEKKKESMTPDQIRAFQDSRPAFWDSKGFNFIAEGNSYFESDSLIGIYSCSILERKETHKLYKGCTGPNSNSVGLTLIDKTDGPN